MEAAVTSVSCSICLEVVGDGGDRSTANLQCGHQFHLDCIGSAFNAKGVMQCPNCRKIEKGTWLYPNGCHYLEYSMEDWHHDEDLYDRNYMEMPSGVHWCPFSRLPRLTPSFEEGETSPSRPYRDQIGHAVYTEHPVNSSSAHYRPYSAYLHPLQSASSSGSQIPPHNLVDDAALHHIWVNQSGSIDIFLPPELRYTHWDSDLPPFTHPSSHSSNLEEESVYSVNTRATRLESDAHPRNGSLMHPFTVEHGSASRAGSSTLSSSLPPYIASSQSHARTHDTHSSYPHHITAGFLSGSHRSGDMRGNSPIGRTYSHETAGFLLLAPAPPASRSRNPSDVEANGGGHFYAWERDQFAPFPLLPVDREMPWWGLPQAPGSSDPISRHAFRRRHSSERTSSQSRTPHVPRMYPFI